ncbi:MAG: hypothetical protein R2857_11155 [Vampirovibrionales bacterium]
MTRNQASNSHAIIQRIIKDRSWDSGYLEYASSETGGESFAAAAYDSQQIAAIYEDIANDIHIKLVKVDSAHLFTISLSPDRFGALIPCIGATRFPIRELRSFPGSGSRQTQAPTR